MMLEGPSSLVGATIRHSPRPEVSHVETLGGKSKLLFVIHHLEGVLAPAGVGAIVESGRNKINMIGIIEIKKHGDDSSTSSMAHLS